MKSNFIIYIGFFDNFVNGKFSKMIFDIVKIMIKNKYIKMILEVENVVFFGRFFLEIWFFLREYFYIFILVLYNKCIIIIFLKRIREFVCIMFKLFSKFLLYLLWIVFYIKLFYIVLIFILNFEVL